MKKINKKYFGIIIIVIIIMIIMIMIITALMLYYFTPLKKVTLLHTSGLNIFETFESDRKIGVVYFAFLKEDRWRTIVLPQMQDLVNCKLAENADIDIVLSGTEEEISSAKTEITNILSPVNTNIHFDYSYENTYEYLGIKKLYEKATENPEKIYLYFHSKGMVFYEGENKRNKLELYLFEKIITNWRDIIDIFEKNPDKNKVSLGCSLEGFCWFNFFWVRGAYLKNNCSPPIISDNRYYYESYIGTNCKNASYDDCYNIADNNEKPYYLQEDIAAYVSNLGLTK